jgi:anti-sigma B factor antagonist
LYENSAILVTNPPPPLELRSSHVSGVLVVEAEGEVDMATAPQLAAAVGVRDGATRVVVDLSAVSFLDSSALNSLVHARRELAEQGISFRVVSPKDHAVRQVFEITQLTQELGVVDSLDAALA